MKVKVIDLKREYEIYKKEYMQAIENVFDSGSFILGDYVKNLEQNICKYLNAKYAIGVGNGTDAIILALESMGIKQGDEIITTPFTFFATAEAILKLGATPVFVDIDKRTYNINASLIEKKISKKTKVILPVHLYGNPADMNEIIELAEKHNLKIVEDCAQSFGSIYNGKHTGTFKDAGTFSFFPTKNLGCAGDGGLIVTNDDNVYEKVRMLRAHGSNKKYMHDFIGCNSRLDSLQASLLLVKLKYIDEWNNRRIKIAEIYNKNLTEKIVKPVKNKNSKHIYHQYTIACEKRDDLKKYLFENGIESSIHYPVPIHKQKALASLSIKENFKNAEECAKKVLSLPIYAQIKEEEVLYVIEKVNEFFKNN